jgi:hypothetical protein
MKTGESFGPLAGLLGDAIVGDAEDLGVRLAHWAVELGAHGKSFRRPLVVERVS